VRSARQLAAPMGAYERGWARLAALKGTKRDFGGSRMPLRVPSATFCALSSNRTLAVTEREQLAGHEGLRGAHRGSRLPRELGVRGRVFGLSLPRQRGSVRCLCVIACGLVSGTSPAGESLVTVPADRAGDIQSLRASGACSNASRNDCERYSVEDDSVGNVPHRSAALPSSIPT
jgi:hypothetical protein